MTHHCASSHLGDIITHPIAPDSEFPAKQTGHSYKLDQSRGEAVDRYVSACAHSPLLRITRGVKVIRERAFCSGRRGVCVASSIGIKKKIPWEWLPKGGGLLGGRELSGSLAPICIQHLKSSFSHSADMRVITNRTTDITTEWHIDVSVGAKLSFIEPGRRWAHSPSPSKASGISYQGTMKTSVRMLKTSGGL